MKLKNVLAGAAAFVMAIGTMAVNSSANLYVLDNAEKDPNLTSLISRWMVLIQNGSGTADCGIDITLIRSVDFYTEIIVAPGQEDNLTLEEYSNSADWFGGAVVFSEGGPEIKEVHGSAVADRYNWNSADWGGIPARGDSAEGYKSGTNKGTAEYDKSIVMEFLNDYSYKLSRTMNDDEVFLPTPPEYCQISLEEWCRTENYNIKVNLCTFRDKDGNIILAYDGAGYKITIEDAQAKAAEYETPKDPEPVVEKTQASIEETQTPVNSNGNDDITGTPNAAAIISPTPSANHSSSSNITFDNSGLILGVTAGIAAVINVIVIIIVFKKK